jgi:hypothetical protein
MREGIVPRPGIAEQLQSMSEVELRQRLSQMMEENEVFPSRPIPDA